MQIQLTPAKWQGPPSGECSRLARWPDSLLEQDRAMRAEGLPIREITARLNGPHHATVWRWVANITRRPPARLIARRVRSK